jgi:hypothetical protein
VSTEPAVVLEDARDGPARTTDTLLASLVVRLRTLALLSGSEAVGSIVSGVAELGRRAALSDEGARIRAALEHSRPGVNGDLLWSTLRMSDLPSAIPPTPVLEALRNDVALLLAPDLERALGEMDETSLTAGSGSSASRSRSPSSTSRSGCGRSAGSPRTRWRRSPSRPLGAPTPGPRA